MRRKPLHRRHNQQLFRTPRRCMITGTTITTGTAPAAPPNHDFFHDLWHETPRSAQQLNHFRDFLDDLWRRPAQQGHRPPAGKRRNLSLHDHRDVYNPAGAAPSAFPQFNALSKTCGCTERARHRGPRTAPVESQRSSLCVATGITSNL